MIDFGAIPPRSIQSFGVAGVLGEDCHIFYSALFDTHQIGKVSDLLCARLRESGVDELQVRMAVLLKIFEAAAFAQGKFNQPVTIECGLDSEKVALGVSFKIPEDRDFELEQFAESIETLESPERFEWASARLKFAADRLIFRYEPATRRFEAVALIGLDGKITEEVKRAKVRPITVLISDVNEATPKAGIYTELGDLDYAKLLAGKDKAGKEKLPGTPAGQAIASAVAEKEVATKLRSEERAKEEKLKIKGSPQSEDASVIRLNADKKPKQDAGKGAATVLPVLEVVDRDRILSSNVPEPGEDTESEKKIDELQSKIAELEARAKAAEEAASKIVVGGSENSTSDDAEIRIKASKPVEAEPEEKLSFFARLKKKVLGKSSKKSEPNEEIISGESEGPSGPENTVVAGSSDIDSQPEAEVRVSGDSKDGLVDEFEKVLSGDGAEGEDSVKVGAQGATESGEPERTVLAADNGALETATAVVNHETDTLVAESVKLEKTLSRARDEAEQIELEGGGEKTKRWMDGLMAELVSEKAKIQEVAKKLELSTRKKELEFKNKERTLQDEIRKKDELLKQRQNSLIRTKEELARVQATLEKAKTASAAANEEGFKQKYATAQKLLSASKDENTDLTHKLDELKNQLAVLKTRPAASSAELTAIKIKFDRTQKQVDELKKTNQKLMDKLGEIEKKKTSAGGSAGSPEDLRRRLEGATKMATQHQKDAADLQKKLDDAKAEQLRLKRDLELAQRSVKEAQKAATKKATAA